MQILCIILKVMTKSYGTNTLLVPPTKKLGDLSPPVPMVVAPMLEGQKRHVCDEVDGLGSVSVWSGGMDIKEIG